MSRFTLKASKETIAAMSERQLRVFHAVNYMLDTLETYGIDIDRSQVFVEEGSGRLVIDLSHRFDDRFSFAVTMQETSRRICVWYDRQSVVFVPEDYDSPDGWIDDGLRLVWDTLRGLIDLEITHRRGEKVCQRIYRYTNNGSEIVHTWWLSDFRYRFGRIWDPRWSQRRSVERYRMQFESASEDGLFRWDEGTGQDGDA